ncbi:MAG: DUF3095 domain-containing protein [Nitrospinae bacterium]|nr:DUF3095 domain-containing protein [Nitrospinota bacterium]
MPISDAFPIIDEFGEVFDFARHVAVPSDWSIVISDVKGSTQAIEAGRYKEVNVVGASSIIAVLNSAKGEEVPYVFGGDGATFLVPSHLRESSCQALLAARKMARKAFGLDLRVGVVPIGELRAKGFQVKMARYRASDFLVQAVLSGDGVLAAEKLVKDPGPENPYLLREDEAGEGDGDFTGLECRWMPVKNQNGETVSLIAMSLAQDPGKAQESFREVLRKIEEIYGRQERYRPISENRLELASKMSDYLAESKVRVFPGGRRSLWIYLIKTYWITQAAKWAWDRLGLPFGKRYKKELVANSDYRKFDGALRMILDGDSGQRARLRDFLEEKFQDGELVYGIHSSDHALMTCLIFDRLLGKHLHLVDGGGGGYAQAAKRLKEKLKGKPSSPDFPPANSPA